MNAITVESTSAVPKALEQLGIIDRCSFWEPRTVLGLKEKAPELISGFHLFWIK
jgi:hypothetical protein